MCAQEAIKKVWSSYVVLVQVLHKVEVLSLCAHACCCLRTPCCVYANGAVCWLGVGCAIE